MGAPDPGRAELVETHISTLVFEGGLAFKRKKPVRTSFLDFSTPELRLAACEREVSLNRRLAPDVYLGVGHVLLEGVFDEPVVVMRRLPDDRRLSTLVRGRPDDDALGPAIDEITRVLVEFHARAERSAAVDDASGPAALGALWEAGRAQLEPYGALIDPAARERIAGLASEYLAGRAPLLEERLAAGRACDGHGDLLAADIFCLDDGPHILDCLEFDDRLRFGDVLADVAFLAMDLERLGAPALAARLLVGYAELAGDRWPASLARHHVAYRAFVRAKVACLRHEQGDEAAAEEARALAGLCEDQLLAARPALVLVGGDPGTGKSTVASGLAAELGAVHLASDELRKDLAGLARSTHRPAAFGEDLYAPEQVAGVYAAMLERAQGLLVHGERVVLDATWLDPLERRRAAEVARRTSVPFVELRTVCAPGEADRRIRARWATDDASDVTVEVARRMRDRAAPWPEATELDTGVPGATQRAVVVVGAALAAAPPSREGAAVPFGASAPLGRDVLARRD